MKTIAFTSRLALAWAAVMLSGCQGILDDSYDEADNQTPDPVAGQLYVDASDWATWHYIHLPSLAEKAADDPDFNTSSLWETVAVPLPDADATDSEPEIEQAGIYTYWYDIFGAGISNCEYRSFTPADRQKEPENWTIAVHRNNVRTNRGAAYETSYGSFDEMPSGVEWIKNLEFEEDCWNESDVWVTQDRMLQGLIGNQGIYVNNTLGGWLRMEIPPMPPKFVLNSHVFIVRLSDGTYAALQLADYMDSSGAKCHLTINYKYPL